MDAVDFCVMLDRWNPAPITFSLCPDGRYEGISEGFWELLKIYRRLDQQYKDTINARIRWWGEEWSNEAKDEKLRLMIKWLGVVKEREERAKKRPSRSRRHTQPQSSNYLTTTN
ncbi:MAG: hypothetical protein FJ009_06200 [Chloroflexi bacterium]|nr:hypothetical protein [Chloroflexota bacterium]